MISWLLSSTLLLLQLLFPLEDGGAERPVRGQFTVLELQVGHGRRVAPAVEPPRDRLFLVREPVRGDVGIAHHLLFTMHQNSNASV